MCLYYVTFHLDLELKHTLDVGSSVDHRVQVWWRSSHFPARRSDLHKCLQTDGQTTDELKWNELKITVLAITKYQLYHYTVSRVLPTRVITDR